MKNITLSADGHLIEMAREEARARKTTLNALFREWLRERSPFRTSAESERMKSSATFHNIWASTVNSPEKK